MLSFAQACHESCQLNSCFGEEAWQCFHCNSGLVWIKEARSSKSTCGVVEDRQIPGYARDCSECGINNYVDTTKTCKPCSYNSTKCKKDEDIICKNTFDLVNGTCKCLTGYFSPVNGSCYCKEADHYLDDQGNCNQCTLDTVCKKGCNNTCPTGTYRDGCGCIPCTPPCLFCTSNKSCNPVIPDDECVLYPDLPKCIIPRSPCALPFEPVTVDGKLECLCPCYAIEYVVNEQRKCKCNAGYVDVNNTCQKYPTDECPSDQYYDETFKQCLCVDITFTYFEGKCIKDTCPYGYLHDIKRRLCYKNPELMCKETFILDTASGYCICNSTAEKVGDKCIQIICLGGQVISKETKTCVCPIAGESLNSNYVCSKPGQLVCRSDMINSNGLCICPRDNVTKLYPINNFVKGVCLAPKDENCPLASQLINSNLQCSCKPGYMLMNYRCLLISSYSCPDQNMKVYVAANSNCVCKCKDGYIQKGNLCTPCGLDEIFYSGKCYSKAVFVCPAGTYLEKDICIMITK
jgi:hypothetical protein